MIVSLIIAMDENGLIGVNNQLPWYLPNDLKYFKEKTQGKVVIMGRKTYESIGKALPNRINIVLSTDPLLSYKDAITVTHIDDALLLAKNEIEEECFIIGGENIFKLAIKNKLIDRVYMTIVENKFIPFDFENPIYFKSFNPNEWDLKNIDVKETNKINKYRTHYLMYTKN